MSVVDSRARHERVVESFLESDQRFAPWLRVFLEEPSESSF